MVGNPAYLMNDLGSQLNNVRLDQGGNIYVGPKPEKSCTVQPGDELCWDYGKEYWANWTNRIVHVGKREQREGGGAGGAGEGGRGGRRTRAGGNGAGGGVGTRRDRAWTGQCEAKVRTTRVTRGGGNSGGGDATAASSPPSLLPPPHTNTHSSNSSDL